MSLLKPLLLLGGALGLGALLLKPKAGDGGFVGPLPGGGPDTSAITDLANKVLDDVANRGQNYDKSLLRQFQAAAAILVDGLYGPESAAALARFTGRSPPPPLFAGAAHVEAPTNQPMSPSDASDAKALAEHVFSDVTANGMQYDRNLMRAFQRGTHTLAVDGYYGPATAGAVGYFTDRRPPDALYPDAHGSRAPKTYRPPS